MAGWMVFHAYYALLFDKRKEGAWINVTPLTSLEFLGSSDHPDLIANQSILTVLIGVKHGNRGTKTWKQTG